jgi:hypothetical protein
MPLWSVALVPFKRQRFEPIGQLHEFGLARVFGAIKEVAHHDLVFFKWACPAFKAVYPEGFVTHAPEQVYSFNSAGLLRRHDYHAQVGGVAASVNYAADHRQVGGLVIATHRRIVPTDPALAPRSRVHDHRCPGCAARRVTPRHDQACAR